MRIFIRRQGDWLPFVLYDRDSTLLSFFLLLNGKKECEIIRAAWFGNSSKRKRTYKGHLKAALLVPDRL